MSRGLTGAYVITTVVTPALSIGLTTLADLKLELSLSASLFISADTPSGTVLPFVSTDGVAAGMAATGTNIGSANFVAAVTQTTVTLANAIIGDVSAGSEIAFSDTSQDTWLTKAIAQASQDLSHDCHRVFGLATYQDAVRPDPGIAWSGVRPNANPIVLRRWPAAAVVSIVETIAGVAQPALTAGVDFEVDLSRAEVYRLDQYQRPRNWRADLVTIQYQAGWVLPNDPGTQTMPVDLAEAALRLATARYRARGRDPKLRSEGDPGIGSQQYWVGTPAGQRGQYPAEIQSVVDHYRVPVLA